MANKVRGSRDGLSRNQEPDHRTCIQTKKSNDFWDQDFLSETKKLQWNVQTEQK